VLCVAGLCAAAGSSLLADDWPQWRGPHGTGVSDERDLPLRWSDTSGVAWRVPLGGTGLSSPVIWGERVFVTSQRGTGVRRDGRHPTLVQGGSADEAGERSLAAGPAGSAVTFLVEAFDRSDGGRLWHTEVAAEGELPPVHDKHNLASASPVTDGRRLYAVFGTGQVVAVDAGTGALAWQRNLATDYGPFQIGWGHGSSPILYEGLIILPCYHEPASYLIALDVNTGATKWRVDRGSEVLSYSTPVVVPTDDGDELVVNTTAALEAYRPESGEALWRLDEPHRFAIPVPVHHDGIIYASRGYRSGPFMALRAGGRGDVSSRVLWQVPTGAPYIASLVYVDGLLFMAGDVGVVTCVEARTGERLWQERTGGIFSASPVVAGDRLYLLSETGETIVMRAARSPEILARNRIDGRLLASPAVSGGRLFLRTDADLVAISGS
jgi:outer membrane protein assembly factor BamB